MRERLLVHLRGLPQIVESWNRPEESDSQPSQFARSLTKVSIVIKLFTTLCTLLLSSDVLDDDYYFHQSIGYDRKWATSNVSYLELYMRQMSKQFSGELS